MYGPTHVLGGSIPPPLVKRGPCLATILKSIYRKFCPTWEIRIILCQLFVISMMVLNSKITPSGLEAVVDCLFT
jgi:hypothetical protein